MSKIAVIGLVGNSAFMSVDEFHKAGETVKANHIHFEPGGKGFNQAVASSRFGCEVSFLGAVGAEYKNEILAFSHREKIKSFLIQKEGSTAFASIITNKKGDTQVTVYGGASLDVADLESFKGEIAASRILLINNEVPEEVNVRAVEIAKENGVFVIMNPAPWRKISKYLVQNVDLFTPNETETRGLENLENIIVTLGAKGCYVKSKNISYPSVNAGITIDTTGAGDTFTGVLASVLSKGGNIENGVKYASIAAGISVTKKYAATSIPTINEIEQFLLNQNHTVIGPRGILK